MSEILYLAKNLTKDFPKSKFKLEISKVELKRNTITGVVGENGNGKTTLLNIIAGNLLAKNETLKYFDFSPKNSKDWISIKDKIAFIPQRIPKWHGTLMQNLQLKAAIEKIPTNEIDSEINRVIKFLDLKKYSHLKWKEISTGYRLRFELARVLIGNPQLLVLDEPIANLDIKAQQKFLTDLREIANSKDYPVSIILSSQQLHEIETIADDMIFLKQGKDIFSGNVNELIDNNNIIEIMVSESKSLEKWLKIKTYEFSKNGVYYQINIKEKTGNDFLNETISEGFEVKYYRNISKSTKKLF